MNNENQTTTIEKVQQQSVFAFETFDHAQRIAKMLSTSTLIPKDFQNNVQNVMIALEIANRIGASPLMVMQNLFVIYGKPSWSSSFIIAALNSSNKFSPLRFELSGAGMEMKCHAWCYETATKEKLIGPTVSMAMAKIEGWYDKKDSKWKSMPELMLRYRSAAFFGRLYAPELLMGMHAMDEVKDATVVVQESTVATPPPANGVNVNGTEQTTTTEKEMETETAPDILETLQTILNEKLGLLNQKQSDAAKRIIQNKETESYQKLFTFLTNKTEQS